MSVPKAQELQQPFGGMTIPYQPKARQFVICDFRGFEAPEMVKRRPVVVLARHKTNSKLVAVVPLSATQPLNPTPCHYRLRSNPIPGLPDRPVWAKCDMVAVVSISRLDLVRSHRRRSDGRREYLTNRMDVDEFAMLQRGVAHALGLSKIAVDPARGFQDSA